MQKEIIITGYTAQIDGLILETNIPACLKENRIPSKENFVSWDKIGKLLFENYTNEINVSELDKLRSHKED